MDCLVSLEMFYKLKLSKYFLEKLVLKLNVKVVLPRNAEFMFLRKTKNSF